MELFFSTKKPHWINGKWAEGSGEGMRSQNPATHEVLWEGNSAGPKEIEASLEAGQAAFSEWAWRPLEERIALIEAYGRVLHSKKNFLAEIISKENGKPLWEALTEVTAMINKIGISIEALKSRCPEKIQEGKPIGLTRHKPHGVVAVLGPYNFPAHLPNGHIIPALLAGNCVIFKPSELTPWIGTEMIKAWEEAGIPPGVIQLLQGGRETGMALTAHPQLRGLFFTGSWNTGKKLLEQQPNYPERILALEMGGNNPLIVSEVEDIAGAAYATILSAYATSGQRCTCARRLIVINSAQGNAYIEELQHFIRSIRIGPYTEQPEPFMGPLITPIAVQNVLERQKLLLGSGANALVPCQAIRNKGAFLAPGLIDVTQVGMREDEEVFGPLLQLIRVDNLEAAFREANRTTYGLAAGLLSKHETEFEQFFKSVRAGVLNWNTPTTGASSQAPFGGVGRSGNYRPSAYYAADYCSYPTASQISSELKVPEKLQPGIER